MKEGWVVKKLLEECDVYQPKTISSKELIKDGRYKVYGANGVIGRYNKYNHETAEILLTCRGATCGNIRISEPFSWINGNAMVIHIRDERKICQNYLQYYLRTIDYSKVISGAAQPQITRISLNNIYISLPSLSEQERIVSVLDSAFAKIEAMKDNAARNLANAKELFQSELQNAMMPKEEWEVKKIKDICEKSSSNVTQQSLKDNIGDYPIYGASGYIKKVNFYHQDQEYIGIVKDGSGIGRTMLLPAYSSVIGTIQYIIPKKPNKLKFIYYALESLDLAKYKNGAAIPHIYFRDYGESIIAVPPIPEQERIVAHLDALSEKVKQLEAAYNKTIADCEELKQSLLRQAFNGEL